MTPRRALLSVSDKSGLLPFARFLAEQGVELLSTGGTAALLRAEGLPVIEVAEHTGQAEILEGRVKTLHPKIHGGLLGDRRKPEHVATMEAEGIAPIDLLVVNLYPFRQTLASGADFETCVENIDIGGPAMLRAAAKNHASVAVVVDPSDYDSLQEALKTGGGLGAGLRRSLARKAFAHTAAYDSDIARWLADSDQVDFPEEFSLAGKRIATLRYGENPHQGAAWYASGSKPEGLAAATLVQGKPLSYNNINDADAALNLANEFQEPAVAIIKHANPCGVAVASNLVEAYQQAYACDTTSAFGGIVAVNRQLDAETAALITQIFTEVVVAPSVSDAAKDLFAAKKNLRLLITGEQSTLSQSNLVVKTLRGGFLLQNRDQTWANPEEIRCVTQRQASAEETADLEFAFKVAKHVKSNAIVLVKEGRTVGIGAGQMSRVDAARIATWKAGEEAKGCVLASDAFFPFADGIQMAIDAGARAVIQPGGSMRDDEVIKAADDAGLAMLFTGMRHFNH